MKSFKEEFDYPIFLNADHTYSLEKLKEAVKAGFDSAVFDGSKLPVEENIKITKQSVKLRNLLRAGLEIFWWKGKWGI